MRPQHLDDPCICSLKLQRVLEGKGMMSYLACCLLSHILLLLNLSVRWSQASLASDEQVLLALKRSVKDQDGRLQDWTGNGSSVCSWSGVTCDGDQRAVLALNLSSMNLQGEVPVKFLELRSLQNLSFYNNKFKGRLPGDFFNKLSNLKNVDLGINDFSGPIPRNFSSSGVLEVLYLIGNEFEGEIPAELGSQTSLLKIDFNTNNLSGHVPPSLCNLANLHYLSLVNDHLEGSIPDCLGTLMRLEFLSMRLNNFVGRIPSSFQELTELKTFDLSDNQLSGPIPAGLGKLSKLQALRLQNNNLSGEIPKELGSLSGLLEINLRNNMLDGTIPRELSGMKSLKAFLVDGNRLEGAFPRWLEDLTEIVNATISSNNFSGEIPGSFGISNPALECFDVCDNRFTGSLPPSICIHGTLIFFAAMNNAFTGDLPEGIRQCRSLTRLRLDNNYLTGSLELSMPLLNFASLNQNSFNGALSLRNMSKLQQLDVSSNRLRGELPAELGESALVSFKASKNIFSGPLPSRLKELHQLQVLDLSRNLFTGAIPSFIADFVHLVQLDLSQNNFSGSITLGKMPALSQLNLSHNYFNGEIPEEIGQFPALETLDLSDNDFSGRVPYFCNRMVCNTAGNPDLCTTTCSYAHGYRRRQLKTGQLVVILCALSASFFLLVTACLYYRRLHAYELRRSEGEWGIVSYHKPPVVLSDILECIVDKGNAITPTVYRGQLRDGRQVAVKNLQSNHYADSAFYAEVAVLGKVRHRNVVKLLASCSNGENHLLVYEYMPTGSLRGLLQGKVAPDIKLDFNVVLKVINGVAEGLLYLHQEYGQKILHRDVKCENILLDISLEPRLGDFGLAKLLETGDSSCTVSKLAGSYGYIAPGKGKLKLFRMLFDTECESPAEYACTLKVDEKTDVYSFGIVMLELLTGKQATWKDELNDLNLVQWVNSEPWDLFGNYLKSIDASMSVVDNQ